MKNNIIRHGLLDFPNFFNLYSHETLNMEIHNRITILFANIVRHRLRHNYHFYSLAAFYNDNRINKCRTVTHKRSIIHFMKTDIMHLN